MSINKTTKLMAAALIFGGVGLGAAHASDEHIGPATDFAKSTVAEWVASPDLIAAIKAQNEKHASLSQDDIDALDKQWRAEVDGSDKPLIDEVLASEVSKYLAEMKQAAGGMVTEVFVMDNRGLNVAQSDVTSDYWQGDEAKWKKTYSAGPEAIFVDEVEMDESTQTLQTQVSMSIKDPETDAVIGAITVGVNVEAL